MLLIHYHYGFTLCGVIDVIPCGIYIGPLDISLVWFANTTLPIVALWMLFLMASHTSPLDPLFLYFANTAPWTHLFIFLMELFIVVLTLALWTYLFPSFANMVLRNL